MSLLNSRTLLACCLGMVIATPGWSAGGTRKKMTTHPHHHLMVYISGYTRGDENGIYVYEMDLATGKLTRRGSGPQTNNPSFLAAHPNGKFLYACNEISNFEGKKAGGVTAFAIDAKSGELTRLNEVSTVGDGPCHLEVDKAGKNVLVANYGGGSVAVLPINVDGSVGEATCFIQHHGGSVNPNRQKEPHAHSINLDASNRFALCADLGMDQVITYRFDPEKHTLEANDSAATMIAPGSGPRHMAYRPDGKFAYVINELNSTVTALTYNSGTGEMKTIQTISTLPEGFSGTNNPAEIHVSPDGKFLYGSNRGHNSLVIYRIDARTGLLTLVGHQLTGGKNPRNFSIDPTGHFLLVANQDTNNVVVFRVNQQTGHLAPTGQVLEMPTPVCVLMRRVD